MAVRDGTKLDPGLSGPALEHVKIQEGGSWTARMALLDDAATTARSVPHLAVLPAIATLLAYENVVKTASAGPGGGMKFPMPAALPDLWTFVSVPNTGRSFELGVPLLLAPVFFVLQAALVAGYLGSIDTVLEAEIPDFAKHVAANTLPVLGVQIVVFALSVASFGFAFVGGMALAPLSVLLGLVVGYLLWAAPILVIVRDHGVGEALVASASHAPNGGRYSAFTAGYLVAGIVVSLLLSTLVRGRPLLLVLATIVLAYPLLIVSVATVKVVKSLPRVEAGSDAAVRYSR